MTKNTYLTCVCMNILTRYTVWHWEFSLAFSSLFLFVCFTLLLPTKKHGKRKLLAKYLNVKPPQNRSKKPNLGPPLYPSIDFSLDYELGLPLLAEERDWIEKWGQRKVKVKVANKLRDKTKMHLIQLSGWGVGVNKWQKNSKRESNT